MAPKAPKMYLKYRKIKIQKLMLPLNRIIIACGIKIRRKVHAICNINLLKKAFTL
jgi:hypothetical protein